MAFRSQNFTPIGGNSRSGIDLDENSPMGWAYSSQTDTVADVTNPNSYFDSVNKLVGQHQFIYASLADNNVIFTISSVDRQLQQVTLASQIIQPSPAQPDNVTAVYDEFDFGDPIADVVTLDNTEKFLLYKTVVLTSQLENLGDVPLGGVTSFDSTFVPINNLFYVHPAPANVFFRADRQFVCNVFNIFISDFTNGFRVKGENIAFDITGLNSGTLSSFNLFNARFRDFISLGTVKGIRIIQMRDAGFFNAGGITMDECQTIFINNTIWISDQDDGDTYLTVTGEIDIFMDITETDFVLRNGERALFIDPNIGEGSNIVLENIRNTISGNGAFFETGDTGPITSIGNETKGGSTTAVADNGGGIVTVTTSSTHGLFPFEQVTLSTQTESSYNGTFKILSTPTSTTFTIELIFVGTSTGGFSSTSIMITSTAHGQSDGQTMLIIDTINYNGGAQIFNAQTNTFEINRVFVSTETGNWDTGSLTGTDKRVTVKNVQSLPDSKTIFSLSIRTALAITQTAIATVDTFVNININPLQSDLNGTQNFTLIDPAAGIFRYDGVEDITLMLSGFVVGIAATGGSSFVVFEFLIAINGVLSNILPISNINVSQNTNGTTPLSGALNLSPGDDIRIQVRNTTNTDNLIIQQMSFIGE